MVTVYFEFKVCCSFLSNILGTCHLLEVAEGLVQMGGGEGH